MLDLFASKLRLLTMALNGLGTLLILVLMAMINLDVLSMNALGAPITGVKESIALSIAVIVFLQMPETLRANRHIASDMWITRLSDRHPRVGEALQMVFHLLGAAMLLLIARFGWPMMEEAFRNGYYVGTVNVFTLPTWPTFAVVMFCSSITALQYILIAAQHASRALSGDANKPTKG
tara:strand:- start:3134 stop:3667 length:534 start_codon:yes stop_codon:yes gene_type:complete